MPVSRVRRLHPASREKACQSPHGVTWLRAPGAATSGNLGGLRFHLASGGNPVSRLGQTANRFRQAQRQDPERRRHLLPGITFLRGGSVAVLMALRPKGWRDERLVVLTKGQIFSRKMAIFHGFSPKASTPAMPRQCFPGRFPVFGSTFRLKNGKPPATPEPPMKPMYRANASRG